MNKIPMLLILIAAAFFVGSCASDAGGEQASIAGGRSADGPASAESADRPSAAIELLERLILDYPDSALTPLGRRRLAELKQEVPRS